MVSAFAVEHGVIDALFDKLARPYDPPITPDPRVVVWAFRKLEADAAANPDSVHSAYFTARRIEGIAGQSFAPNPQDPRWKGEHGGLKDEFFARTVETALTWWQAHRAEFER